MIQGAYTQENSLPLFKLFKRIYLFFIKPNFKVQNPIIRFKINNRKRSFTFQIKINKSSLSKPLLKEFENYVELIEKEITQPDEIQN